MKYYLINWIDQENHPISRKIRGKVDNRILFTSNEITELQQGDQVSVFEIPEKIGSQDILEDQSVKGTVREISPLKFKLEETFSRDVESTVTLVQRRIPESTEFLENYNKKLAEQFINNQGTYEAITNVGGVTQIQEVKVENRLPLIIELPTTSVTRKHLNYTKNINLIEQGITNNQMMECVVIDIEDGKHGSSRAEVQKIRFSYGNSSPLETYKFDQTINNTKLAVSRIWNSIMYWFRAFRAQQYFITLLSIILGVLIASSEVQLGNMFNAVSLIVIGTFAIQAGGNLLNDYFDHQSELDDINILSISNRSEVKLIQNRLIHPSINISVGLILFFIGASIGLYLNWQAKGNIILILGIIGAITTYFYTGEPLKLVYRGIGEIILALNFGPLIILGTIIVVANTRTLIISHILLTIPSLMFITGLLILNEIDDIEADSLVGKKTTAVRLGKLPALILSILLVLGGFAILPLIIDINAVFGYIVGLLLGISLSLVSILETMKDDNKTPRLSLYILSYPIWILLYMLG